MSSANDDAARHGDLVFREGFEYQFSSLQPMSDHIDPPALAVYESLLAKDDGMGAQGLLAGSWRVDEAGTEWLIKLRPNLKFHSGAPCDAQATLDALNTIRGVLIESGDGWYWDAVRNMSLAGPDMLRFELHHPSARVSSLLWGPHTLIHNEASRTQHGADFGHGVIDGTGPYRVLSWSPERVVAERWLGYARPEAPLFEAPAGRMPDRIEWISVRNERERLAMLEEGELECVHATPADQVERLTGDPRFEVYRYPQPSSMYLTVDWERHEFGFDDLRVRRALYVAVDRREIVDTALSGCGSPTWGPLPPGLEFYDPSVDVDGSSDPREANQLLDAAGFEIGADGVRHRDGQRMSFPCVMQDDETFRRVGAIVVRQLAEIGVELHPTFETPFVEYYEACKRRPISTINKWLWQDPMDALIGFCATANRPFLNWSNASSHRLDEAFAAWVRGESGDDLHAAASEAQQAFVADLPYIPLLTPDDIWVWHSRFRGYAPGPGKLYPYYHGLHVPNGT